MSTPGTFFLPLSNPTSRSCSSCSLCHDLSHDILPSDPQEDGKQDSIKGLIEKRRQGPQGRTLLARDKSVMSRTVFDNKNTLVYPRDITPPWYACSRPWVWAFGVHAYRRMSEVLLSRKHCHYVQYPAVLPLLVLARSFGPIDVEECLQFHFSLRSVHVSLWPLPRDLSTPLGINSCIFPKSNPGCLAFFIAVQRARRSVQEAWEEEGSVSLALSNQSSFMCHPSFSEPNDTLCSILSACSKITTPRCPKYRQTT